MLKDERMSLIYNSVREGAFVCDVGTDHAIIPIELIKSGKCPQALVTDISAPSLEKGIKNIEKSGLSSKIKAFLADGTLGVPIFEKGDFIIAGMGGELIVKIIEQDERLKNNNYRFIIQPMTKPEEIRRYLFENGFKAINETKIFSENKLYAVIVAEYTGEMWDYSIKDLLLGITPNKENPAELMYARRLLKSLKAKLSGLEKAEVPDMEAIEKTKTAIEVVSDFCLG